MKKIIIIFFGIFILSGIGFYFLKKRQEQVLVKQYQSLFVEKAELLLNSSSAENLKLLTNQCLDQVKIQNNVKILFRLMSDCNSKIANEIINDPSSTKYLDQLHRIELKVKNLETEK